MDRIASQKEACNKHTNLHYETQDSGVLLHASEKQNVYKIYTKTAVLLLTPCRCSDDEFY
jgi:hypothetical protein